MPHLSADTLETDPEGCAFLASVLNGTNGRRPGWTLRHEPARADTKLVIHLGRELRTIYVDLIEAEIPHHLAELAAKIPPAAGLRDAR
jgi:hypothetical protein